MPSHDLGHRLQARVMERAERIDDVFARRAEQHFQAFWEAYRSVYTFETEEALTAEMNALLDVLETAFGQRPQALKAIDHTREHTPRWIEDPKWVGMMLYVDLFAGSLQGVRDRIPYLQELGITYLHLMPLLKSRPGQNDGGYAVSSYREVEPRLGSMADLRALAEDLCAAGILLVLDFVMNHTAIEHKWAQQALAGDADAQSLYLFADTERDVAQWEETLPEVFPDFAPGNFTKQPELGRWVWTTFYRFQWDLDYANPVVFRKMLAELLFLANVGADVLRLDAVPFMWKRRETDCRNQPEVFALVAAYRALTRMVAPGLTFKAEAIVSPEQIVRYLGAGTYPGQSCELAYNATLMNHVWHAVACQNTQLLTSTLKRLPVAPPGTTWINYLRCHDDIGWGITPENAAAVGQDDSATRKFCSDFYAGDYPGSYAHGFKFQTEADGAARTSGTLSALTGLQRGRIEMNQALTEEGLRRITMMNAVAFFMPGIPVIYSGDELAQSNDLSYLEDTTRAGDNRWVHRPAFDWERAEKRFEAGSVEARVYASTRRLAEAKLAIRSRLLDSVCTVEETGNDALFSAIRRGSSVVRLVANVSISPTTLSIFPAQNKCFDAITGISLHPFEGLLPIPPLTACWLTDAPVPSCPEPPSLVPLTLSTTQETTFGESIHCTLLSAAGVIDTVELATSAESYPQWEATVLAQPGVTLAVEARIIRDGTLIRILPRFYTIAWV